jgi:hypothetical protein
MELSINNLFSSNVLHEARRIEALDMKVHLFSLMWRAACQCLATVHARGALCLVQFLRNTSQWRVSVETYVYHWRQMYWRCPNCLKFLYKSKCVVVVTGYTCTVDESFCVVA